MTGASDKRGGAGRAARLGSTRLGSARGRDGRGVGSEPRPEVREEAKENTPLCMHFVS